MAAIARAGVRYKIINAFSKNKSKALVPDLIIQNNNQFDCLLLISPNIDSRDYKEQKFYSNAQGAITTGKRRLTQLLAGC